MLNLPSITRFNSLLLVLFLSASACSDVLIPDIESDTVLLISPPENAILTDSTITFQWQDNADAEEYRLEIAKPSFNNLNTLVVDTFLFGNQLTINLPLGDYEWRVQGFNAAFSTNCCEIGRFSVTQSMATDTLAQLQLRTPALNTFVNELPVFFSWDDDLSYQNFEIQISTAQDFSSLLTNTSTISNTFALALLTETTYFWRVRGVRSSETGPWASASFTLDYNPPFQPVPLTPENNQTIDLLSSDPDFSWQANNDVAFSRFDLFTDTLTTNLVFSVTTTDSSINLDTVSSPPEAGTYFWRISSRDEAGNFSSPSPVQRVIIE